MSRRGEVGRSLGGEMEEWHTWESNPRALDLDRGSHSIKRDELID